MFEPISKRFRQISKQISETCAQNNKELREWAQREYSCFDNDVAWKVLSSLTSRPKRCMTTIGGKCEHNYRTNGESVCHFDQGCFDIDDTKGPPVLLWENPDWQTVREYPLKKIDGTYKIFIEVEVEPDDYEVQTLRH